MVRSRPGRARAAGDRAFRHLGRALLGLTLLAAGGCAGLDRESYSLIYRKPAHQYERLSAWQREELERYEATRLTNADGFVASVAYQGFRPFRYCHRHRSYHVAESIGAVAVAPVEFPVTVSTFMGGIVVRRVGDVGKRLAAGAVWLWQEIFGKPKPEIPPVDHPDESKPKE